MRCVKLGFGGYAGVVRKSKQEEEDSAMRLISQLQRA